MKMLIIKASFKLKPPLFWNQIKILTKEMEAWASTRGNMQCLLKAIHCNANAIAIPAVTNSYYLLELHKRTLQVRADSRTVPNTRKKPVQTQNQGKNMLSNSLLLCIKLVPAVSP